MNYKNLEQLAAGLRYMDSVIFSAVARAQEAGFDPANSLRGLVITDEDAQFLAAKEPLAAIWGSDGDVPPFPAALRHEDSPLADMGYIFGLSDLDLAIVLLCFAVEIDQRYERLYAYLQDDVTQRRPTVNLIMNLLGSTVRERFQVWERLGPEMPLRQFKLLDCLPDPTRPHSTFITHQVKLDRRTVTFLLGNDEIDERIQHAVRLLPAPATPQRPSPVAEALAPYADSHQPPLMLLYGEDDAAKAADVSAFCASLNLPVIRVDLHKLAHADAPLETAWGITLREALFHGAALLLDQWSAVLDERSRPNERIWRDIVGLNRLVFISAAQPWEPLDELRQRRLLRLSYTLPSYSARIQLWQQSLHDLGIHLPAADIAAVSNKFRLTTDQIARAVQAAADWAATKGRALQVDDLIQGAQAHASLRLDQLAQHIQPRYTWHDLILPPEQTQQIRELIDRVSYAATVHTEWGFGAKGAPIRRVSALFAGESGTGKTLAAEVIAHELGLVMYKIDLSSVVSKYIGETEKNLKTIFDEARAGNAILFFDEADALFGKRSEVKDAHDRYANIEVAYLLQQIENYDGVAIMATNLRQNLDDAFTRRLDFVIDFPFPDAEYRQQIWKIHFPSRAPISPDVDIMEIAERYRLAGGNIRNAALAAAFLAASENSSITMQHIKRAIRREHQKMGRLLDTVRD